MPDSASMKIDLPGVDFGALAREAIAAKLTEAMVGADDAVRKIVASALAVKVSSESGKVSEYHSRNDVTYMEWLAQDLVRQATRAVLASKVERLRPEIERAVEAALRQSIKPAAKALTETFIQSAKNNYALTINVAFTGRG